MLDNWRLLAAAILRRAYRDARRGDGDALTWLTDEGADWLDCLGLDSDVLFTVLKH